MRQSAVYSNIMCLAELGCIVVSTTQHTTEIYNSAFAIPHTCCTYIVDRELICKPRCAARTTHCTHTSGNIEFTICYTMYLYLDSVIISFPKLRELEGLSLAVLLKAGVVNWAAWR
jgi:hypothetical protein